MAISMLFHAKWTDIFCDSNVLGSALCTSATRWLPLATSDAEAKLTPKAYGDWSSDAVLGRWEDHAIPTQLGLVYYPN